MNGIFLSLIGERLKKARKDLGLNQAEAADLVGVTREHWGRCERGAAMPGGEVFAALAAAGADVNFILTGQHAGGVKPAPTLTSDEEELLALFRAAPLAVKAAAIGALQGGASAKPASQKAKSGGVNVGGSVSGLLQTNTGHGSVQIGHMGSPPPTPKRKG